MAVKLVKMETFDDLLLPAKPCDLLIFWSLDNQSAQLLKGAFQKNQICLKVIENFVCFQRSNDYLSFQNEHF